LLFSSYFNELYLKILLQAICQEGIFENKETSLAAKLKRF